MKDTRKRKKQVFTKREDEEKKQIAGTFPKEGLASLTNLNLVLHNRKDN